MPSTPTPEKPEKKPNTMQETIDEASLTLQQQDQAEMVWLETTTADRLLKLTEAQLARLNLWDNTYADLAANARAEYDRHVTACRSLDFSGPGSSR